MPFFTVHAMESSKSVPSSATQYIFESLVKSALESEKPKAPMKIEATNLECILGSGKPHQFNCKATFTINTQEVRKPIAGDQNKFFEYLDAKGGIAVSEVKLGGTEYKAKKITCSYSLDQNTYYTCVSDISTKF